MRLLRKVEADILSAFVLDCSVKACTDGDAPTWKTHKVNLKEKSAYFMTSGSKDQMFTQLQKTNHFKEVTDQKKYNHTN